MTDEAGGRHLAARTPYVVADPAAATPVRLGDPDWRFGGAPDLATNTDTPSRLRLLSMELALHADTWDRATRGFLDAYMAFALAATDNATLSRRAARFGGLFAPQDWAFAAYRPLPRAQLLAAGTAWAAADAAEASVPVSAALWTGRALVAVELPGASTPTMRRRQALARLPEAGIMLVTLEAAGLADPAVLARRLPGEVTDFWREVDAPPSPFVQPVPAPAA
ncbi:MAG: hypothetical protein AB7N54_02350 [Alphaproteobacteria bacterium]